VLFVGVGEGVVELVPYDPAQYARALFGDESEEPAMSGAAS
jgi:hypothetical protein